MSSFMDQAKENFKKVPPLGWVAIVGGFILLVYLSKKKSSSVTYTPAPTYDSNSGLDTNKVSETDVANQMNSMMNDLSNSFNQQIHDQADTFNKQLSDTQQANKDMMDQYNQSWSSRVDALTSSYQEQTNSLHNQLGDVSNALGDLVSNEKQNNADLLQQIKDAKNPVVPTAPSVPVTKPSIPAPKPSTPITKPAPPKNVIPAPKLPSNPAYHGVSIVDYLKGAGAGSSMSDRTKLAGQMGIKNYTGTSSQNTQMLHTLESNAKKKK